MSLPDPNPRWPVMTQGKGLSGATVRATTTTTFWWVFPPKWVLSAQSHKGFVGTCVCSTGFDTPPVRPTSIPWILTCLSETFFLTNGLQVQLQVINGMYHPPAPQFGHSKDESGRTLISPLSCYDKCYLQWWITSVHHMQHLCYTLSLKSHNSPMRLMGQVCPSRLRVDGPLASALGCEIILKSGVHGTHCCGLIWGWLGEWIAAPGDHQTFIIM